MIYLKKYLFIFLILFIALIYFAYIPVSYNFDGTVFSHFLRYSIIKKDYMSKIHPHHLLYLPLGIITYKALSFISGTPLLEYFHLQIVSLFFGLLTLIFIYRILLSVTSKPFLSIAGVIMIAFSYSFWLFSVEAEVHMPGIFFIISGIFFLFFQEKHSKKYFISAILFSLSAGFHLTNILILVSVLLVFIARKTKMKEILIFYGVYIPFTFFQYFLFSIFSKTDLISFFKNVLFGKDIFAGYRISYWSPISIETLFFSLNSVKNAIFEGSSFFISLLLFAFLLTLTGVVIAKRNLKSTIDCFLFWMLPYFLFFSLWDTKNIEFKLNIVIPLLILFVISISNLSRIGYFIIALMIIFTFINNFYYGIRPRIEIQNNRNLLLAEAIEKKTDNDSIIVIAGNTKGYLYGKIYIPYFAGRTTWILDWILGKGLSLNNFKDSIVYSLSKRRRFFFLSELVYLSDSVKELIKTHNLSEKDYNNFLKQLKFGKRIELLDGFYLLEVSEVSSDGNKGLSP